MDDIRQMRIFVAIAETSGLSAAARQLDVSTALVSRGLSMLETRLGVRLATRTTRSLELTEEGQTYYERVRAILHALKDVDNEINQNANTPAGVLRVGVHSEIGRNRIAPLVARFVKDHPEVEIRLVLADEKLDVIQSHLDIAIRVDLPTEVALVARKLMSTKRVLCAAPEYISRFGNPETPDDLLNHSCIRLIRENRLMDRWVFERAGERYLVKVSGVLATDNGEVMHDWVLAGHGISLKARWDIEADLQSGTLIQCLSEYECTDIELYVVYASRRHLSLRIRRFVDFLVAEFDAENPASKAARNPPLHSVSIHSSVGLSR